MKLALRRDGVLSVARKVAGSLAPYALKKGVDWGISKLTKSSQSSEMARNGRSKMSRRSKKGRRSGKKGRGGSGKSITKYHDIKSVYSKRGLGGRKRRALSFRKKVIKAICEDGPAKQVLMNSPGLADSGVVSQSLGCNNGTQGMGVVGALYTYAGSGNIGEGNRDCFDLLYNACVSDVQVYEGAAGASTYSVPEDSKIRVEGAHAEFIISNPSGGQEVLVDLYECVARRDISSSSSQRTLGDLMVNSRMAGSSIISAVATWGSPATPVDAMTAYGVTPFQVDGFVHQFKILKTTRIKLEVGSYATYSMHDSRMRTLHGEDLIPEIGSMVAKKGLTKVLVARVFGPPRTSGTATASADTNAATLRFNCVRSYTVRNLNNTPQEFVKLRVP